MTAPLMTLKIRSHSGAIVAEHRVPTHFVPRVGESIVSFGDADNLQGVDSLLVVDVEYELDEGVLTPTLLCVEANLPFEKREEFLREWGWLPDRQE